MKVSSSVIMHPIFCVLSIKTNFTITRVSDYNVYESRDPSCQLMKCHTVTTLPFTLLLATKKQDVLIISALLVEINKKREENFPSPHLPCYSAPTHEDCKCFPLGQRFLKFPLEVKWKGSFWLLPTGIFEITSRGGPLISVGPV